MTIVKKIKSARCCVSSKTQMKWFKISTEFTWDWPEGKSKSRCTLFLKKLKKLIGKLKIKTALDLWVKHISSWFLSHFLKKKNYLNYYFFILLNTGTTYSCCSLFFCILQKLYIILNSGSFFKHKRVFKYSSEIQKIYSIQARGSAGTTARNYLIAWSNFYPPVWTGGKKKYCLKDMESLSVFPSLSKIQLICLNLICAFSLSSLWLLKN